LLNILSSGWYLDLPGLRTIALEAKQNAAWFVLPDGTLTAIGDSAREKIGVSANYRDPTDYRFFPQAGYFVARSGGNTPGDQAEMLVVTGARHSTVHKHEDDLSFELFARGRRLLIDAGKFGYANTPLRRYFVSAEAHNRVTIPGDADALLDRTLGSRLQRAEAEPWGYRLQGAVQGARARWRRIFFYRPGVGLVIVDHVDSPSGTAQANLLSDNEAHVRSERDGWRVNDARITVRAAGAVTTHMHVGVDHPLLGWASHQYGERSPCAALTARFSGPWLVTSVVWQGEAPTILDQGAGLALRWGELHLPAEPFEP
jgi:hypothetical protein